MKSEMIQTQTPKVANIELIPQTVEIEQQLSDVQSSSIALEGLTAARRPEHSVSQTLSVEQSTQVIEAVQHYVAKNPGATELQLLKYEEFVIDVVTGKYD